VFCGITGKAAAARPWAERLKAIDPLTPLFQVLPAVLATMDGRFDDAIEVFARHYAGNLDNPGVRLAYGQALALGGRKPEALAIFDALARDFPDSPFAQLGEFYADSTHRLTPDVEAVLGGDAQYCWFVADAYAVAGEHESAINWLGRAASLGFINYPLLAEHDPLLKPLRGVPRFEALLGEIGERWERFAV
jgi:predicted Zn-dependent protease